MPPDKTHRSLVEAPNALEIAIATLGLGALAFAYPLLEVIGRGPEFLVAHRLSFGGIVILMVALLSMPLVMAGIVIVSRSASRGLGILAVFGVMAVLGGLLAIQVAKRLSLPNWALGVSTGLTATVFAVGYLRRPSVRLIVRYLAFAPLVIGFWFIWTLPSSLKGEITEAANLHLEEVKRPTPIVMVIFDELPTASLIDEKGGLLSEHFPGFAQLARDGVWYRQNTTVHETTTRSVPAILSGMESDKDSLPLLAEHPRNLFTLLSETHDVSAIETVTDLCPAEICGDQSNDRASLVSDLMVLYGHIILPSTWSTGLPPLDQGWAGFVSSPVDTPPGDGETAFNLREKVKKSMEEGRSRQVARFLDSLGDPGTRPPLRVAHFLLPHSPWQYLADGREHRDKKLSGYPDEGFGGDPYFVAGAWRRHLLQVGYVDTVVRDLLDGLKQADLYDRALVIVTADHGITFQPDIPHKRRVFPETNGHPSTVGSIVPVPLFVKYPSDLDAAPPPGTIVDTFTRTVDLVPTVLDVLGADPLSDLDGVSLIDPSLPPRTDMRFQTLEDQIFEVKGVEMLEVAKEKMKWFPQNDVWALLPEPELRELLGAPIVELDGLEDPNALVEVAPKRIDPEADPFPVIAGTVHSQAPGFTGDELIAVTIDDHIAAITKTYETDGTIRFFVLVNPSSEGTVGASLLADPQILAR